MIAVMASNLFPARLRVFRVAKGMTTQQLADAVGVSRRIVQNWESGKHDPKLSHVRALAKVLGVQIAELTDDQPDDPPTD